MEALVERLLLHMEGMPSSLSEKNPEDRAMYGVVWEIRRDDALVSLGDDVIDVDLGDGDPVVHGE